MIDLFFEFWGREKNKVGKKKFKIFLFFILSNVCEFLRMIFNFDFFNEFF